MRLGIELDKCVGEITASDRYHEPVVILVDAFDTGPGVKYPDRYLPKDGILSSADGEVVVEKHAERGREHRERRCHPRSDEHSVGCLERSPLHRHPRSGDVRWPGELALVVLRQARPPEPWRLSSASLPTIASRSSSSTRASPGTRTSQNSPVLIDPQAKLHCS